MPLAPVMLPTQRPPTVTFAPFSITASPYPKRGTWSEFMSATPPLKRTRPHPLAWLETKNFWATAFLPCFHASESPSGQWVRRESTNSTVPVPPALPE